MDTFENNTILVVDDNPDIRKQLKWGLRKEGYDVQHAGDVEEALLLFKKYKPQVVTLDLGLPPKENTAEEGLRCLSKMLAHSFGDKSAAKIIVITGNTDRENALKAVELGAYDFFQKPINLDEIKVIIRRALHLQTLESENRALQDEVNNKQHFGIIGESPEIQKVLATIRKVAASELSVMIYGESGTGKELMARAIHDQSARNKKTFVPVNCGAIPENLIESEFFGHEKGAFTGADNMRRGMIEYADKGTLFLDEIGELPANLQVKLLRFLQEMTFRRIGGREDLSVDVRIISATNVDINKAVSQGDLREDLYYRIGTVTVNLPPLRERGDDVLLLAEYFLKNAVKELNISGITFSPEAVDAISGHSWPGNVRELENAVRRAVIMAESESISAADLGIQKSEAEASAQQSDTNIEVLTLKEGRERVERNLLEKALGRHSGNISNTSKELGISRPTLYGLLKKYKLLP
jgi:two-component system NtrC family response regulator